MIKLNCFPKNVLKLCIAKEFLCWAFPCPVERRPLLRTKPLFRCFVYTGHVPFVTALPSTWNCHNGTISKRLSEKTLRVSMVWPWEWWKCNNETYVYWTVRHLDSWMKIDHLPVTCFIISLFIAQRVSNVSTSILRSLRLICRVISWLYCSGSMCVGVTVWFGWGGVVSLCRLQHWSASACNIISLTTYAQCSEKLRNFFYFLDSNIPPEGTILPSFAFCRNNCKQVQSVVWVIVLLCG